MNNKDSHSKFARWIIGIVTTCIVIYLVLKNVGVVASAVSWVWGLIMPLTLGLVFALVINVPMTFFVTKLFPKSKNKVLTSIRKPLACILSFFLILGIVAGIVVLVIPELINAVKIIAEYVIKFASNLNESKIDTIPFGNLIAELDWKTIIGKLESWLKAETGSIMSTAVVTISSCIGGIVDFYIAVIFSIYILFNKTTLKRQIARLINAWLPKRFGGWLIHASEVSSKVFRNFVSGQTLEGIILGTLCMIGMLILRIPYAPMVGALVGVSALVPVVGSIVGAVIGAFMIFTVSPVKALIFIIFLIILQQLEGNLIYPRVMSSRINLPPMWVLAAVTIGGGLAGPIGMLIGVPATSVIYILLKEATENREKSITAKNNENEDE